jgi:hypothetical protein
MADTAFPKEKLIQLVKMIESDPNSKEFQLPVDYLGMRFN